MCIRDSENIGTRVRQLARVQTPTLGNRRQTTRSRKPELALLRAAGADDTIVDEILKGVRMAGSGTPTGFFDTLPSAEYEDFKRFDDELIKALKRGPKHLEKLLSKRQPEEGQQSVLKQTKEEADEGKFDGPWDVYRKADGSIHSDIPFDTYLPTLRFPRAQGDRDSTSYKFRPIDDCSGSGLNSSTGFSERMRMHGLETFLACAHECRVAFADQGTEGEPVFAKGDHEKAYRQWPVFPGDRHLLLTLVWDENLGPHGGFKAYAHRALPFGALRAVWVYTAISQGICAILRRLLAVPQLAYVDDFLRVSPRKLSLIHI